MYDNIGGKIKGLAKAVFIVEAIGAVITGIALLAIDEDFILAGLLTLFCGPIIAWIGSWILYAFGELVEDTHAIRKKYYPIAEEQADCEAEEKAKREAEKKIKREAELKEQQESAARAKREVKERAKWQEENKSQNYELSDDDFIDIACPKCGEMLSFLKNETKGICPECGTEFEI